MAGHGFDSRTVLTYNDSEWGDIHMLIAGESGDQDMNAARMYLNICLVPASAAAMRSGIQLCNCRIGYKNRVM